MAITILPVYLILLTEFSYAHWEGFVGQAVYFSIISARRRHREHLRLGARRDIGWLCIDILLVKIIAGS